MPSPVTQRRTSNRHAAKVTPTKPKPVDTGSPLGPYDSDSVRDRIRKWQAQGGGVVTASDIYVEEEPENDPCIKPSTHKEEKHAVVWLAEDTAESGESATPRRRSGRRKSKIESHERNGSRSTSAPKKRVVSDEHWRKKRSPTRGAVSPGIGRKATTGKTVPDSGIRVTAIPDTTLEDDKVDKVKKDAPGRDNPNRADDIRFHDVSPKPKRHSWHQELQGAEDLAHIEDRTDLDKSKVRTPTSAKKTRSARNSREPTPDELPHLSSSAAKRTIRRRTFDMRKEDSPERSPHSVHESAPDVQGIAKPQKSKILSQVYSGSTKPFSTSEPNPILATRIPSVEAWLTDTPDPFVDDVEPPVEMPAPLKSTSRRRRERELAEQVIPEDPNKIWKALDAKDKPSRRGSESRTRRRIRSAAIYEDNPFPENLTGSSPLDSLADTSVSAPKLVDLVQDVPDLSPPTVRRRGARRDSSSPRQGRHESSPLKETFTPAEDVSVVESVNSGSSVEPHEISCPLRPPSLRIKRPFPSTGLHRLSTIASVETFNSNEHNATQPPPAMAITPKSTLGHDTVTLENDNIGSEARDIFDPDALARRPSKSRLTRHADLISVLSVPKADNRSIQSARSIRTNRSRLATATIDDLMKELAMDETKYMRELRTLVDGVIPVLLTCVLSKSDSAIAVGLFSGSAAAHNSKDITRPIMDMGIALERLKALHNRIPIQNPDALLTWAQGATRVYAEYLKSWRMGFQDVVVNLAPSANEKSPNSSSPPAAQNGLDEGLPTNEDGDIVDSNGERVDVAYLLKRPLVRLKYLAKTFKGMNLIKPSTETEVLATKYQALVIDARHRSNEERARLEDEAAASIDPTRARDPRTLAPVAGVSIDQRRRVRARDYFNLTLHHSSAQKIDCRVELLLRDDAPGLGTSGDVLICEVDGTGRWLLLPPIQLGRVSARNGDLKGEIVVMVRGTHGQGHEWHELLLLRTEDERTGFEWVQMLGLTPVPPKITRTRSFISKQERRKALSTPLPGELIPLDSPVTPTKSRTPSPREIEVPIGEYSSGDVKAWIESPANYESSQTPVSPSPRERNRLQKKLPGLPLSAPNTNAPSPVEIVNDRQSSPRQRHENKYKSPEVVRTPRSLNEALGLAGVSTGLRRTKAKRRSRHTDDSSVSPQSPNTLYLQEELQSPSRGSCEPCKQQESAPDLRYASPQPTDPPSCRGNKDGKADKKTSRPTYHRARSSVPSLELPIIPKIRKDSPPSTPTYELDEEPEWPKPSIAKEPVPCTPTKLLNKPPDEKQELSSDKPPPPPAHRSSSPVQLRSSPTPNLGSPILKQTKRRSSSPLKHEYEPSTASETSSDSDALTVEHNEATSVSDSSEDEELEDGDAPTPLLPLGALPRLSKVSPHGSIYSLPNGTLSPSQSASQAPYKTVPSQPNKASKTIASMFFWSDKGSWQPLHPDECSIVITPGLIEAYEMSAAHSNNDQKCSAFSGEPDSTSDVSLRSSSQTSDPESPRPLVALEVTPLVPIRRGTAVDISIRSPPTAESKITTISNNNIMFRSRNPEECEALYALINHARINNPTYIALQNARVTSSFPSTHLDRSNTSRHSTRRSSWFGIGHNSRSSYRASSAPTPSIAPSDSSVSSMTSAFSALKRFGKPGSRFSISRSTVTSRNGSRANSIYTSSDNSSGSGTNSPVPGGLRRPGMTAEDAKDGTAPIGLSNAKIRLYIRESNTKWRDLGSARLTIMRPTNATHPLAPEVVGGPGRTPGSRVDDKRIVVIGKTGEKTLLDVTLGETSFERVARTGIAVGVWEAFRGGEVAKEGGVVGGNWRIFMIQVCLHREVWFVSGNADG